jgi:hypothetical protein
MGIDIVSLTDKGNALSRSTRSSNDIGWKVIYFLGRVGGRSTRDNISLNVFGGNQVVTNNVLRNLKSKGIVA